MKKRREDRIIALLDNFSKSFNICLLSILLSILVFYIFPAVSEDFSQWSDSTGYHGGGWFLHPASIYEFRDGYNLDMLKDYITVLIMYDILLITCYVLLLTLAIVKAINHYRHPERKKFICLPLVTGAMHLIEDGGLVMVLASYPVRYAFLLYLTAFFSALKWGLFLIILGILFISICDKCLSPSRRVSMRKEF